MATPKSRLGRGLGALITSGNAAPKPATPAPVATASAAVPANDGLPGYREIAVHLVEPNPYQPRKEFSDEALTELVESIRAEGLLQPVVVRAAGDKFQLIAGERRWRAFQLLKLKTIPARVVQAGNASAASMACCTVRPNFPG